MLDILEDTKNKEYFKSIFFQFIALTVMRHARVTVSYIEGYKLSIMSGGLDATK